MIRTFVDALPQKLGQSIMRKTKQSTKANTPPCKKGLSSLRFLSFFLILFLAVGNVWGTTFTYSGSSGYDAATNGGTTRDGITIVFSGGSHSNSNGGYWNISAQNTTITISSNEANITSVAITHTDGSRSKTMSVQTGGGSVTGTPGTDATLTYSHSSAEKNIVLKYTASGARVVSIEVTTVAAAVTTHTVTAVTSTGTNTYGTVSAAASSVAEGGTTTITATPNSGYQFDHWTVSGTGASLSSTTTNPTTLTMGTSDVTVTAYFVEKTCPSSGTLYSAVAAATSNISIAASESDLELNTSTHKTTVTGGSMSVYNGQTSAKNLITSNGFSMTHNNTFFKIVLDCELAAGDIISIAVGKDGSNERGVWVSSASSRPGSAPACALTATNASLTPVTYTVTGSDEYHGKTVLYIYRATGNTTYFNNINISRSAAPSCTAPNHVDISGRWDRFGGETISLTAAAYASAGTGSPIADGDITGWQWEKLIGSTWTALSNGTVDGVTTSGATTKNLQIANCGAGNSGKYRCVVSTGATCSTASATATDGSEGFGVKVYVLECYNGGTTEHHFTRTGDSQAGTLTMTLTANTAYTFKVHADNTYYGNNGTINKDETNWVMCNSDNGGDCAKNLTVNSGLGGTFTFGIEYSTSGNSNTLGVPEISVTYPRKTIYLNPGVWNADGAKYAIYYYIDGHNDWSEFFAGDVCGLSASIPQWNGVTMNVVRLQNTTSAPGNWGDKWNQTSNISVDNNDCVTITGWGDGGDSPHTYTSYTPSTFTISFDANEGIGTTASVTNIACGSNATLTANAFTRTGYTFAGWATTANGEVVYADKATINNITSDITLYAKWTAIPTYTVTLNGMTNGIVTASKTTGINEGETITLTVTPASGYQLETLTVKDASDNTVTVTDNKFTMPASNVTVSATFTAVPAGGGDCEEMVIFNGSTMSNAPGTSGSVAGASWNTTGTGEDIDSQAQSYNEVTYKGWKALTGKTSNSRYISIVIDEDYNATLHLKAYVTSTGRSIFVSSGSVSSSTGDALPGTELNFTTSKIIQETTIEVAAGTYFICSTNAVHIAELSMVVCPTCTAPATPLAVSVDNNEITVGGTATITTTGGNESAVTLTANGGTIEGNIYTAPATPGTYTITATQPKNGEKCAGEATCTITVTDLPNAQVYDLALNTDNVCAGENATLTLSGSRSGVNYQLFKDGVASGTPVEGTGNALTWTVNETATYTVKSVANATYKETTMNGTPKLTVSNTPTITITGQGTVTQGEAVTLTATAAGATSFEWFSVDSETTTGGTSVATTATYTPDTDTEGTYYYYCVATNSCGSDSRCVAVVVKAPEGTCGTIPSTGASVTLTNSVTIYSADGTQIDKTNNYIENVTINGNGDKGNAFTKQEFMLTFPADVEKVLIYAYRDGAARTVKEVKCRAEGANEYVNLTCEQNTGGSSPNYVYELSFSETLPKDDTLYVKFSGTMYFWQICYVSSCEDLVPTVTPRAAVLCDEGSVTLTATNYTAEADLQWYKDGVAITGATTDTYTASEAGVYTFGANKTCERTSNEVAVVAAQTPVIETQPTNASTATGVTNSDIFVKATGATSYQWYTCDEDGGNPVIIAGQTAATLNVTHELPGTYYYKVVVIGGCDLSVTSNVASLEVVEGACFSMVMKAKSATLSNDAEVTKDMADITGGTVVADGNSMSIKQYSVPNTNTYISEIELKNYLKVTLASGSIGKGTVIRVVYRNGSSGSGRGVQILKTDETVIHSFTNKTSTLTEETYEVTADMDVSEFYIGRATSNTTYLSEVEILGCVTPCEKPIITTQPVGNNYCNDTEWDNRESLSVTVAPVTDGGTLSYQWYKDGAEIDGATSSTYKPAAGGQYYCIVTNTLGGNTASTTSNEVTVFNQSQNVTLTWNFKTGNRPNATQNSTTSLISNLTDITATGVNVSSDAKGDRTVKFATVADPNNETDGATFSFDVEELYDFTPSTISMKVATVATTFPIRVTIKDEIGQTITGQVTPAAADKETDVNFTMPIVKWMGKVTVLVQGNASGAEFRLFGDVTISGVVECGCTPPVMAWKQGETEVTEITVGYTAANFYEFPTLTNPGGLEVTYASTDENVATVDAMGVVTPRNNGTTVISAKYVGDANLGICPITVTYVLTIVCDDDQPMITTSVANPLDCNDEIPLQLVASDGVTPISSGFVQWYRNGVAIQGATEYTYEAGRTGTYTATLQINCLQTTSNSAVITNKQTEPTVTKLVSQQKIRNNGLENGQRPYSSDLKYSLFEVTPTNTVDYTGPKWKATAMIHYQNGDLEDLGEVTWMREDATTATSITLGADFYEVSQVVLNKSLQKGDAIYVTVAPANACDTIDKYIMDSIPILVTDRYSLAYIITGTKDGGFFDVDAEPLADPVFTLLQDYYDVTAVNGYAPFSLNNYEPFDLVLLTDYPKTSSHEAYISALAGLVDEKPMLSFKAHMSGVAGWTEKGFLGNSVVPGCVNGEETNDSIDAQSHFHVLCYAHDMFQGVGLTDINNDGVVEELEILTGVAKDGKRWKGMQGFTASDASNFVNIAIIHDSQDETSGSLVAACERQEVVDARFMMLSINNLATKYIGGDGTKVIANILEYLLHSDPTAVSDCSLVFDDNNGTGVWSDPLNWAPAYNMVPERYHNVRIDRPCKVDQLAAVALVKVRKDTETTAKGQKGYWQGSLTVQPGKKLTVFGDFGKVQGKNFMDITPLQGNYNDLVIETDADEAGAFAIDPDANSQANAPDATIKFYSQGTGAVAGSEDPSQALWHYMAIPTTGVQMAVTPFSGAWVCRWDEQVPNASNYPQAHWYVVHEEDQLMPFEGYALTQANPTTYTITGRINVGNPTINTLTYTPVTGDNTGDRTDEQSRTYPKAYPGFNLLGNSYTAPIKLSEIPESAFSTNLQKTIYIYNAGTWAQWYESTYQDGVVPEDGTSKTPGQYLALPLNANLGDGALKWIPAMQGFFVRVIGDGSATISGEKIDIDYLNMVVQPNYDDLETPPVPRAPQKPGKQKVDPNQSLMKMTVKGKRFADNLYLLIQDECSHEFDNGWDGDKIYGNARTPQLFAIEKYGPMAVNTVDDINGQSIGFFAGEDSEYTISYDPTEMREHYTQLYLHDMTTGTVTDMFAQNEYTFSVGKQGEVRRFVISTSPDPHWDTSDGGLLRAWAADEMLYVENFTDSEGDYTVFDAAGRRIAYGHLPALGRYSFQLKLIPGAYTVNVRTNSIVKPVKVIF